MLGNDESPWKFISGSWDLDFALSHACLHGLFFDLNEADQTQSEGEWGDERTVFYSETQGTGHQVAYTQAYCTG